MSTPLEGDVYTRRYPSPGQIDGLKDITETSRQFNMAMQETMKVTMTQIEVLSKIDRVLTELLDLQKLQRPLGLTAAFIMTLPAGANNRLVHVDFITGTRNSVNVPAGATMEFPLRKMYSLVITNDGPDSIFFSLNKSKSDVSATVKLLSNESSPPYNYPIPAFETINIALEQGATNGATVRMYGLV